MLKILQEKNEEVDEDRNFLISLVPAFRKLDGEQKLLLKEEILKCLRQISYSQSSNPNEYSNELSSIASTSTSTVQVFDAIYLDPHDEY